MASKRFDASSPSDISPRPNVGVPPPVSMPIGLAAPFSQSDPAHDVGGLTTVDVAIPTLIEKVGRATHVPLLLSALTSQTSTSKVMSKFEKL